MRKTDEQIRAEILQPFFEIVNKIACETNISIHAGIDNGESPFVFWYLEGSDHRLNTASIEEDEFSEDEIVDWVMQLQAMYSEWMGPEEEPESDWDEWDWREDQVMNERRVGS